MMRGQFMSADYHILKRKNKAGKTVLYVAFLDSMPGRNGRPKYKAVRSLRTGNESLARKRIHKMIEGGQVFAARDDLADYLITFWSENKSEYLRSKAAEGRTVSEAYCENNRKLIQNYFLPYFEQRGLNKLSDLSKQNLLSWRNELHERGTFAEPTTDENGNKIPPKTIAPVTQNKVRQAVWTALQWAVDMDMLPVHPGQGIRRVAESKTERKIFEREELGKLFTVQWEDIRVYAACMLAAETGMRLGEVRGLLFENLHLDDGYLDVVTNYVNGEGLKVPKWDSKRVGVPISPRCTLALREAIKVNRWAQTDTDFVFASISSRTFPITVAVIKKGLQKAMKLAKIPADRTFHSFRHSFITHGSGVLPAHILQRLVGHRDDATTARYQHVSTEQREAMQKYQQSIIPFPEAK